MRYGIQCPGCEAEILVRLSVYPSEGIRFYFPCPECEIPITGNMKGEENIDTLAIRFDDCQQFDVDLSQSYKNVVTVAPNVPLKRDARGLDEVGGAPNAIILHIAGNNVELLMRRASLFHQTRYNIWPDVRRFYEYYLQEQWDLFATAGKKAVSASFEDPSTGHGRESETYRAVSACIIPLATGPFGSMMGEIVEYMELIFASTAFRDFAIRSVASGDLQREQRRIWDCLCLLMKTSEIWFLPGVLWDLADANPAISLDQLSLSLDEFHQLRDVYVASFETICRAITYVMAFINTSKRVTPEAFTTDLPPRLAAHGRQQPPRTFAQFNRLTNFEKLAYLYEWPALDDGFRDILDNRLRNAISHNSARHDLRTDMIVNEDESVMSYFEFTAKVYRLNTVLQIVMNILHSVRMAATELPRPS
jgi:hypothetical protein